MEQEEIIQMICNKCREENNKQLVKKDLFFTHSIIFGEGFWEILMNHNRIKDALAQEGYVMKNIVIDETIEFFDIQLFVDYAIEQWKDICKNAFGLNNVTIILTFDSKEFKEIKSYLPQIQKYIIAKNFEIKLDSLDNRLLISNVVHSKVS